tara:strand:- start:996 stop:1499 length:504 start_codon:yes stop_codon:yes gene_type:complete
MALKADRYELQTDISFFYDDGAVTRGGVVVHDSTAGSGAAMDQGVNKVIYKSTVTATDSPVGILLNDVVNKDLTRTHLNQHKDEVQLGGKVTVLRKGYVVTNSIEGTPSAGDIAYVHNNGNISNGSSIAVATLVASGNLAVGRFLSSKDEDGYAKVEVNLPQANVTI